MPSLGDRHVEAPLHRMVQRHREVDVESALVSVIDGAVDRQRRAIVVVDRAGGRWAVW